MTQSIVLMQIPSSRAINLGYIHKNKFIPAWLNRDDKTKKGYSEIGRLVGRSRSTVRRHLIKGFSQTHVPNPYTALVDLF